jgi:hypothetical protein
MNKKLLNDLKEFQPEGIQPTPITNVYKTHSTTFTKTFSIATSIKQTNKKQTTRSALFWGITRL